jgi:hypothetical protein
MVSPDSQAIACPLSGRNSTYRSVQISGTGSKGGETATLVYGFYGVGEGGVTAFTEYGHRVLEVRGVQFSTGQF